MVTDFQKPMSGKIADNHCVSFDDLTSEVIQYNFLFANTGWHSRGRLHFLLIKVSRFVGLL